MYKYLASLLLSAIAFSSFAGTDSISVRKDHKTSVTLSIANFSIAGLTYFDYYMFTDYIANQFGVNVEHKVNERLRINIGFNTWNTNAYLNRRADWSDPEEIHLYDYRFPRGQKNIDDVGALRFRYGYKMIDIAVSRRWEHFRKHKFTGGLGLSFTWGTNYYLDHIYFDNNINDYIYRMHTEVHGYGGVIVPLRYDYLFAKNRMSIGLQTTARKYLGLYSVQVDYGMHVSININ